MTASKDTVDINGIEVPQKVLDRMIRLSESSNSSVGIWEAIDKSIGIYGFIISPVDKIYSNKNKTSIQNYEPASSGKSEFIPEPFYIHEKKRFERNEEFYPQEDNNQISFPQINTPSNPQSEIRLVANNKHKVNFMMKKADWQEIGLKSGWISRSDLQKEAIEPMTALLIGATVVSIAAPFVQQYFDGSKEESEQTAKEISQNPQEFAKKTSQMAQNLENLISQVQSYVASVGLPCNVAEPTSCKGAGISGLAEFNKKYEELSNKLKNPQSIQNPCQLLYEAMQLKVCSQGLLQIAGQIENVSQQISSTQSDIRLVT